MSQAHAEVVPIRDGHSTGMLPRGSLRGPTVAQVLEMAAIGFDVPVDVLTGDIRTRTVANYRHVAMAACRWGTAASLPEIGRAFGRRDHTTVLSACEKVGRSPELTRQAQVLVDVVRQSPKPLF